MVKALKPSSRLFTGVPEVDLTQPEEAKRVIVKACQEFGLFKVVNHGVPMELITLLENEALNFFMQTQSHKDKAFPPDPYCYGRKQIGTNGDVGLVEYLLINTNPQLISPKTLELFQHNPQLLRCAVEDYIGEVKKMCCQVLELMADGLEIRPRNVLSRMIRDEKSDSCLRINCYTPCQDLNLIGFGEHTDPQIISLIRSNNTSGFQMYLQDDATWVSIPPHHTSFFVNVGDLLQVMTNGRFKSVKHRVLADSSKSRLSMIYFGGPPLNEKIGPLASLVSMEEESLYRELTWREYKKAAYKSRLSDYRLSLFEKSA